MALSNYDYKTIGRYPPRAYRDDWDDSQRREQLAEMYFFDGKSMFPLNGKRELQAYTGGTYPTLGTRRSLRHNDEDYARAFLASEYAFRCINVIATDVSGVKHGVRNRSTKAEAVNHPLVQAVTWARITHQQNLIALWQKSLGVWGETYVIPCANDFGFVSGLRWLNPIVVEPNIVNGAIQYYEYRADASAVKINVNKMIFDKVDNLLDDIRGQSKIAVALDAINTDREIKRYTLDMLLKDMRMAGILTGRQGSGIQQHELDAALAKLKDQKDSRVIALSTPLEYQRIQQELDDSQLSLSEDARRRIAAALGVPMSIAGAWDSATYQSAPEQKRFYYENVIFPECRRHTDVMNDVVMPFFDTTGEYEWYYDIEAAEAGLEDKTAKVATLNSQLASGAITLNEYRQKLGDEPLPNGDVLFVPSGAIITPVAQLTATPIMPPAAPAINAVTPPATPEPAAGTKSAYLTLAIGAQPDLISLQNRAKEMMAGSEVEWNAPDDFHVTLVYLPVVSESQVTALNDALQSVELPEMALKIGSLRVFDNLGNYAVHFQIRRNADLLDLQETLHSLCAALDIPASAYSAPEAYKPHITIGYSKTKPRAVVFEGKLTVAPVALELADNEKTLWRKACREDKPVKAVEPEPITEAGLAELAAWEKKVRNKSDVKATFKAYLIRDEVADSLRAELEAAGDDKQAVKAAFDTARQVLSIKAVQATRIDFEDAFSAVLDEARKGTITRTRWGSITRQLIRMYGARAFRDGLADGGVNDEPDEADQDAIVKLIQDQSTYVTDLGARLFKDENAVSDAMAEQKAALWWNGSIAPFYSAGLLSADKNGMYTWILGATEEHCDTCAKLNGQKKRYKTWYRNNLVAGTVGQATDCEGWRCECKLKRVAGKSTVGDIAAILLEHEAEHQHE